MSTDQPRTPAGSPAGGQFAGPDRPEAAVDLAGDQIVVADDFYVGPNGEMVCDQHLPADAEGWDLGSDHDAVTDAPNHCENRDCEALLPEGLTDDGVRYVIEACTYEAARPAVVGAWADRWGERIEEYRSAHPDEVATLGTFAGLPGKPAEELQRLDFVIDPASRKVATILAVEPVGARYTRVEAAGEGGAPLAYLVPSDTPVSVVPTD